MAGTKNSEYEKGNVEISAVCRALGHPARVALVRLLMQRQKATCGELVSELPLSQSTVSSHLKALKEANILVRQEEGTKMYYSINTDQWSRGKALLEQFYNHNRHR